MLALAFLLPLLGCGPKGIAVPKTVPVSGSVLVKGRPVANVRVTFHPQFDIGRVPFTPSGVTDRNGQFRLSTGAPNDGAPPGNYVVTFELPRIDTDRNNSGIEIEVDAWGGKYKDPDKSRFSVTIQSGQPELPPFKLD
jgi:hypothetical protein